MADVSESRPISGVPLDIFPVELQSQIAKYIDEKSLYNAIRVNKEWFDRLIDLLWRTGPINNIYTDSDIYTTKSHLQFYAQKICKGYLSLPQQHIPYSLRDLRFRSIKRLAITQPPHSNWFVNHVQITPFLQPTLRSLTIDAPCSIDSYTHAAIRECTGLHTLHFGHSLRLADAEEFVKFLEEFSPLRSLYLGDIVFEMFRSSRQPDSETMSEVLVSILKRGNLEEISVRKGLTKRQLQIFLGLCISFPSNPSLQSLRLMAHSSAIIVYLKTATASLRRLNLYLKDPELHVFDHIHRFKHLTSVSLNLRKEGVGIASRHLDTLRVMTQLRILSITTCSAMMSRNRLRLDWLSDGYFISWIASFPCLHNLQLDWECDLSRAALASIARSCPNLVECRLGWKHDLSTWNLLLSIAPLFPRLEWLRLGEIESFAATTTPGGNSHEFPARTARVIVPVICGLFPRLRALYVERMGHGGNTLHPLNRIFGAVLRARQAY